MRGGLFDGGGSTAVRMPCPCISLCGGTHHQEGRWDASTSRSCVGEWVSARFILQDMWMPTYDDKLKVVMRSLAQPNHRHCVARVASAHAQHKRTLDAQRNRGGVTVNQTRHVGIEVSQGSMNQTTRQRLPGGALRGLRCRSISRQCIFVQGA